MLGLAAVVALLGVFRGPLTDMLAAAHGVSVPHAVAHPAYWCYYAGAFLTGIAFLVKFDRAPLVGVAFSALALAVSIAAAAAPATKLFLIMAYIAKFLHAAFLGQASGDLEDVHDPRGHVIRHGKAFWEKAGIRVRFSAGFHRCSGSWAIP